VSQALLLVHVKVMMQLVPICCLDISLFLRIVLALHLLLTPSHHAVVLAGCKLQAGEGADVWDVCRSGLGLYLVQQALSSMGSSINASSEPGRGSSFCFELPLADSECESESELETDMFSEAGRWGC
jgi:hypothetical protein